MQLANTVYPEFRNGQLKWLSSEVLSGIDDFANVWYVDGNNGSNSNVGNTPTTAFATIQAAVTAASADDIIFIRNLNMTAGATDPSSYTENIVIPAGKSRLKLIGYNEGLTQGGVPQIKVGTTTTQAILTVRSPGCLIYGLGINGVGGTGGGILLDDDGSTKTAFGTTIQYCHFKNCRGTSATSAAGGGAIQWSDQGNAWQVRIVNNVFYKNLGDVVLLGTSGSVPQDVVIEDNIFSGPAASVSCNLLLSTGSGMNGVTIQHNVFPCFPTAGGANVPVSLTGCVGMLSWNTFGCNGKTFGAAANIPVPTTVGIAGNYQDGALIART